MSLTNRIGFFSRLLKDKATFGATPLTVVINITSKCNLKCGYCYGEYYKSKAKDFTTKELLTLVDDLAKLGTKSITLGGGEPLLRQDLGLIIRRIKKYHIECGFNTNGILIPQKLTELKKADSICISLDGPQKLHDKNRGRGSFELTMGGLETALKAGLKVHTTTVLTKHNLEAVDWLVDLAKIKGFQTEFNFLFEQGNNKANGKWFMANDKDLRIAAKKIVALKKQGAPILFSQEVYEIAANWPDYQKRLFYNEKPKFKYLPCSAGRFMIFIDADGLVYPCVQLIGKFPALNFKKVGIKKAWENCLKHPCQACYFPCFNEFNAIASLNGQVILGQVLSSLKNY